MKEIPITIIDKEITYTIERRKVKYIRYELKSNRLKLILPNNFKGDIETYIHKKDKWIYKKLTEYENLNKKLQKQTSGKKLINRTLNQLKILSEKYIENYQKILNVKVNRVQYRDMTKKWGSCSSLRNITLSKSLRYLPDKLVAYIIYHELAHILVLAHNDEFFNIIKKEFPDYKKYDECLIQYWYLISNI